MLILSRKKRQSVVVAHADGTRVTLTITVVKVDRGRVHLAFAGDGPLPVHLAEAFQPSECLAAVACAAGSEPVSETHQRPDPGDQRRLRRPERGHDVLHVGSDADRSRELVVVEALDALSVADRAEL
jgi:sRNA-binding carbon storage regulator CsrA